MAELQAKTLLRPAAKAWRKRDGPRYHGAVSNLGAIRFTDTSPDVENLQLELFRKAPAWRKLELMDQLNQSVKLLALSVLRHRFPGATEAELRLELARLILGRELADRVYADDTASV